MPDYIESIRTALEKTYTKCRKNPIEVNVSDIRWIIFSDQHRGQGDGADDFLKCKSIYHAALGYYLSAGYTLFLLGDVEDLWESYPSQVIRMHRDSLELERRFIEASPDRYFRIFGNHDDLWSWRDRRGKQNLVRKFLAPYILRDTVGEGMFNGYSGSDPIPPPLIWPDDNGNPRRKILREADFEEILLRC